MRAKVIGEHGMLGSAIVRALAEHPIDNGMFMCAAKVGGIQANMLFPADFISENLRLYLTWIPRLAKEQVHESFRPYSNPEKALFFGSSCMYPRECRQPMRESDLWTGPLEPTNEGYAVAKLAGEAMCRAYRRQYGCRFITAILCNLYGPGDHYEPERSHVIPALIRKFIEARRDNLPAVQLMGTGRALREFMYVDDAASAALFLMDRYDEVAPINVGSGEEISVYNLAVMISGIIGYQGQIQFTGGEEGMPRKLLDSSRIREMGWSPKIGLREGLERTIAEVRL